MVFRNSHTCIIRYADCILGVELVTTVFFDDDGTQLDLLWIFKARLLLALGLISVFFFCLFGVQAIGRCLF